MKNKLLLTIFLMFLFVLPAFAGGTNENLLIDLGGGVTFEMVKIPAGTFQMGSPDGELDRLDGETLHNVTLTKSFWMGKYEVTQGQWTKIMGSNPSKFISGDNYPVECVSWDDICQTGGYLEKINTLKPGGYSGFRLPTEAEWEFSCRANTTTAFYWGASANGDYLWYGDWVLIM
jgi:formylglycine-generating enzyme required for sulfatase activity